LALVSVAGCSRPAPTAHPLAASAEKDPVPSLECVLFRHTIQGRGGSSSTLPLRRHDPDRTESVRCCRIEQPRTGPNEDTALRIDVSCTESRDGTDVYTVGYHLTAGGRESSRAFEVRYTGEPVTAIDDEYGQLVFRPPTR